MFVKFNLIAGLLALLLFGYAQSQGWDLFENAADGGSAGRGSSGGRVYHK